MPLGSPRVYCGLRSVRSDCVGARLFMAFISAIRKAGQPQFVNIGLPEMALITPRKPRRIRSQNSHIATPPSMYDLGA